MFWRKTIWNCITWGSDFEVVFFDEAILKIFFAERHFENVFFKGAILKMFFFFREQFW